jgi:hypothetical protein
MFGGARRAPALVLILVFGLAGCWHKSVRLVLPQGSLTPIELERLPTPDSEIATLPSPELGPLPAPTPPKPVPKKKPATATKEEVQPPVLVASEAGPAELAIGSLSTGGDAAPQSRQQAQDVIATILKRIAALPTKIADAQKKQIRQVRNFLDQAQKALNSGDAEGANNLAVKARVLMDDLEKK